MVDRIVASITKTAVTADPSADTTPVAEDPYFEGAVRLTSGQAVNEVLRSRHFTTAEHEECGALTGGTVIRLDGAVHLERRRMEAALFSRTALKQYEDQLLRPTIEHCLADLADQQRGPDGVVRADLMALSRQMMLTTSAAIIGLDGVDDPATARRLGGYRDNLMAGTSVERRLGDHEPILSRAIATKRKFAREFVTPSLQRRKTLVHAAQAGADNPANDLPIDLLTLFILHRVDEDDPELVLRECILYMAASTNTTSMVITDTARELFAWLVVHPSDRDLLPRPAFLRQAIDEALRLHPPAEVLRRRARYSVTLQSGRQLAAGQLVAADLAQASRDADVFGPDSDCFNPRRQVPEGASRYGHSFGAGPHMCIGRPLVLPSAQSANEPTQGAIAQILGALFAAGMEPDAAASAEAMHTYYAHMASLPVRFNRL
jgi:cytochrome P450